MIVLDTNVVSELFRPTPDDAVVEWVTTLTGNVAITTITVAELLAGVRRLDDGKRKAALVQSVGGVLDAYDARGAILPFDTIAAEHHADVVVGRVRAGQPISTADAQIAAICRARAATCATRNTKDFAGTGIDLVNRGETTQKSPRTTFGEPGPRGVRRRAQLTASSTARRARSGRSPIRSRSSSGTHVGS